ncbi:MAG: ATP-dependent 6-phosphofructokinase [Polyangiales bacterium]
MQRIAVLTSGGDAPGMNAAIRAVVRRGIDHGMQVFGVQRGFAGLIRDSIDRLDARDVGGIMEHGGTFLGSARSAEWKTEAGRSQALHNLARRGIEAVIVIGGNGSQTGANALSTMGFPVVGIASTIDNDLFGSDLTIGCDTALNTTIEAMDRLRTTGASHHRAHIVETMGRDFGYLGLMAGIAGGAEVISIPELEVEPTEIAQRLRDAWLRGKTHSIVVVAEGCRNAATAIHQHFEQHESEIGFTVRVTILGHIVRGGPPTAADRLLATRLGVAAVDTLADGQHGVLVGMQRQQISRSPLAEVAATRKKLDLELITLGQVLAR